MGRDLGAARIALLELGFVGRRIFRGLLDAGVQRLELADRRPVTLADLGPDGVFHPEDLGRPRADAAAARHGGRADRKLGAHAGPEGGAGWWRDWLEDADAAVLACDLAIPAPLFDANAVGLALGVPLLPAVAAGTTAVLGPWVRAGEGPCLRCVALRISATRGRPWPEPPMWPMAEVAERLARRAVEVVLGPGTLAARRLLVLAPEDETAHPILRTARCPQCSPYGPFMAYRFARPLAREEAAPVSILELRGELVSPLTGPIRSLEKFATEPGEADLEHWHATVTDVGVLGHGLAFRMAGGTAADAGAAIRAALGESVERLACVLPRREDLFVSRAADLDAGVAVDPRRFDLFHEPTRGAPGFPFLPISPDEPASWLWGVALADGRPRAIPASRVFVNPVSELPGDRVDHPMVSGFAAGTTRAQALAHALLEVLERDAFMIAWTARVPLVGLDLGTGAPQDVAVLVERLRGSGVEVRCATVRLDLGTHLVVAIARSDVVGEPASVVASAAGLDLAGACRRALGELALSQVSVRRALRQAGGRLPEPEQVVEMRDHGLLWARPDMIPRLERWWSPPERRELPPPSPPPSHEETLERLLAAVAAAGLEALAIDLTPPELRELGLWCVKVLVPGTYPMIFGARWPHLGGRRLYEVPEKLGLLPRAPHFDELERTPHPFP